VTPIPPSRRDLTRPPPDVTDLGAIARRHSTNLRALDPGFLDGLYATPQPVPDGASDLVGGDGDGGQDGGSDDIAFWNTDQALAVGTNPGQIILLLTWEPIDGSLHIRWNGIDQPPTEWTLDGQTVTFTSSLIRTDDLLTAAYAYDNGELADPSDTIVPFGSTLWRWLEVPFHDPGNYSDPLFDDSAWDLGQGPFGDTTPDHDLATFPTWPPYVTVWDQNSQMWARRTITAEPGIDVTIWHRINRTIVLWWNGAYKGKTTTAEGTRIIPGSEVLASNVIVFKAADDGYTGPHTGCYFDASVQQVIE
jgi:hypothetical protein